MKTSSKNYDLIEKIASENGLKTRELTSGLNGYPEHLTLCVTDFKSYSHAKLFADKYDGRVTSIRRRDGWNFSQSQGLIYSDFDIRQMILNDLPSESFLSLTNNINDIQAYLQYVKDTYCAYIQDADDVDILLSLSSTFNTALDYAKQAEYLNDDEFLLVYDGSAFTLNSYSTHYVHDVWTYDIAVEFSD